MTEETLRFLARLGANCVAYGNKTAIELLDDTADHGHTVTYAALDDTVRRTMAYLTALGVQRGDRIALMLPKGLPFIYLHLATMRLGAISLPLNPGYPARELRYFLEDAEARLLFTAVETKQCALDASAGLTTLEQVIYLDNTISLASRLADHAPVAALPQVHPNDTCLMIYTSGTTGRPKGAELTHRNLTANLDALHTAWGWRDDDIILHVLPIFHVHGLIVALHGALHAGATAILLTQFAAEHALHLLQTRACTVFMAVPTIHRRLTEARNAHDVDLSHMRLMTSGSDRLPDQLFTRYQTLFGQTLLERYGMSETGMLIANPLNGERRRGSVGLPLPGVSARIVDPTTEEPLPDGEVGAVQVTGDNVFKGYWRQPEKTTAAFTDDGWLRTGDLGMREPDGYFTLKGRAKDLIISGGFNVYPPEVEFVLAAHPDVAAVAVVGCPNEAWGETVTAVIVPTPAANLTADAVIEYCRERLARYKAPRRVEFVDQLPRNALGKVQKARLRANLCDQPPQ